jgi:phospholipid/cholesterol/gamma-HCH transport system substrate-binding protein
MPRTRSLAWTELKIGIVTVTALGLAGIMILMLSGSGGFSWQRYSLKTVFDNIAGLNQGSQVRIAGVPVGQVTAIDFLGNRVEVTFEVSRDMQSRVTSESTAALGSVSLLGESSVDITPSVQGTPLPEWGYVKSAAAPGSLAGIATSATVTLDETTKLLQDLRAGRGTVGQLFTDDALYRELNTFVQAAQEVADNVNRGRGTLGRLAQDPAAAQALEGSLKNLEAVTARLRAGEGSLGKLLNDDAFSRSLTGTTANLETTTRNLNDLTGRINKGEGTAGKLVTDPELYNRLNSMSDRLDKLVGALNQGEGTAGQLLRDKQLYENMNGAVVELRNLVKSITADPKKYLNVRVSLF